MKIKKTLLLVYPLYSSFVKEDNKILSKIYNVVRYRYRLYKNPVMFIIEFLKMLIFLCYNIFKINIIYCWFADYHTFLPILFGKIFNKKTFLILGGYDVTYIPEIRYGSFSNPIRAFCTSYSIRNAFLNLAVSENIRDEALMKIPLAKIEIVHTGYSKEKFFLPKTKEKENIILTVGLIDNYKRYKIKGIDLFCQIAEKLPEYKFILIGVYPEYEKNIITRSKNLEVLYKIHQDELITYYQKAKVYAQFSVREGLPNSVCEAMLCECIPVGTKVKGIQKVIGNCGFILENRDVDEGVKLVKEAIKSNNKLGKKARERIINNFSLEKREKELFKLLREKIE